MSVNWKKRIICQESSREALKCPLNSDGTPEANRQTHLTFLQNVNSFWEAESLSVERKFGDDVEVDCLCRNHGSWHKSSHLKFSLSKIKKAQERTDRKRSNDSRKDEEERPAPKCRKRQSLNSDRNVYSV